MCLSRLSHIDCYASPILQGVDYVLSVTSSDTSTLLDPESTIPRNGTIPPQPYRESL